MKLLASISLVVAASAIQYNFENPTLVQTNQYKFDNVAAGVDAVVTFNPFPGTSMGVLEVDVTHTGIASSLQPELSGVQPGATDMLNVLVEFKTNTGEDRLYADDFRVCFYDVDGRAPAEGDPNSGSNEIVQIVSPTPTSWEVEADTSLTVQDDPVAFFGKMDVIPGIDPTRTDGMACAFFSAASSVSYNIGFHRGSTNTRDTKRMFSANFYEPPTFTAPVDDVKDIESPQDSDIPDIAEFNVVFPTFGFCKEGDTVCKTNAFETLCNHKGARSKFSSAVFSDTCVPVTGAFNTTDGAWTPAASSGYDFNDGEITYTFPDGCLCL